MNLNEKLAKWARWEMISTICWQAPNGDLLDEPDFTESLDLCFKWLIPDDYQQIIFQPGYCGLTVNDTLYEGEDLPRAIEKLIDGESNG